MSTTSLHRFALAAAICAVAACSQSTPGTSPAPSSSAAVKIAGNVCDQKLLTAADFTGVTASPVTSTKLLAGDPQTCTFVAGTDAQQEEFVVSLRAGLGRATIGAFTSGHMNEFAKWQPFSGAGESAIWMPELGELQAQKSDVLCDAHPSAMSHAFDKTDAATRQKQLATLCNTVFDRLKL
jgi:hypothetical protein